MSFHESSTDIELDDDHILKATLRDGDGEEHESELNLNEIIGNNDGKYSWSTQKSLRIACRDSNSML